MAIGLFWTRGRAELALSWGAGGGLLFMRQKIPSHLHRVILETGQAMSHPPGMLWRGSATKASLRCPLGAPLCPLVQCTLFFLRGPQRCQEQKGPGGLQWLLDQSRGLPGPQRPNRWLQEPTSHGNGPFCLVLASEIQRDVVSDTEGDK